MAASISHNSVPIPGKWQPLPRIWYGFAIFPFAPTLREDMDAARAPSAQGSTEVGDVNGNGGEVSHQVALEVGDEIYVFEHYLVPDQGFQYEEKSSVWYRGYVVSTSHRPNLPATGEPSSSANLSGLAEEPLVHLGIFPASHCRIREQLEDAERRLSQLVLDPPDFSQFASTVGQNGHMAVLPEEDENEVDVENDGTGATQQKGGSGESKGGPSHLRKRSSVSSISKFTPAVTDQKAVAKRLSLATGPNSALSTRPAPPLPSLKCGDETASGVDEPLIDEIACAIREWSSLLYTYLYRKDYTLFHLVHQHIEALHMGRRQLLAKTLSNEEATNLRKDLISRLVQGNIAQGLDVIVRHPARGGIVDTEADSRVDPQSWISAVRMYSMQVALGYSASPTIPGAHPGILDLATGGPHASAFARMSDSMSQKAGLLDAASSVDGHDPQPTARFFHVLLDLKAFVASPAAAGETTELYFSLYNKAESRFLTEEFCTILNHHGAPAREAEGRFGRVRTLFKDLSQHDIQDHIFLVCRIVKNGAMKMASSSEDRSSMLSPGKDAKWDMTSFDSSMSPNSEGMITMGRTGKFSFRRPFGCAVLDIGQYSKETGESLDTASLREHDMPIFVPSNEASFSTLHEDIIASRIKEGNRSTKADKLTVHVRIVYGEAATIIRENPALLHDAPLTARLGFADVAFPGDVRNEVYIKLWSGDFGSATGTTRISQSFTQIASIGGPKNVEVAAEIRTADGSVLQQAISRGSGEPNVTTYHSLVFRSNNAPTWGELMKLDIPIDLMEQCHVFFVFRNRVARDKGQNSNATLEKPFAFAFLPLFPDGRAFIADGSHTLALYKSDRNLPDAHVYLQLPSVSIAGGAPNIPLALSKTVVPLRDTMVIRTFLCSTRYTQNEVLLKLLRWETLPADPNDLKDTLNKLRFCSEIECCKFLRDIFQALFGILGSARNRQGELDDVIFNALVTLLGIISDRRFTLFKPVVDLYIDQHFNSSTASSHIIKSFQKLLASPASVESGQTLRSAIKVWHYLFKIIVRSREIQRNKDVGLGVTSEHLESNFKREVSSVLSDINRMMAATSPSSIIGTQTLAVQHFSSVLPSLAACFSQQELVDIVAAFLDNIVVTKGKIVIWRLLFLADLVRGFLFDSASSRAALLPHVVRQLKSSLGKFDDHATLQAKDPENVRDSARVAWLEGARLSISVVAAIQDKLQSALVDDAISQDRTLLGQEHDNLEYLLSLLPRLLDTFREFENPANLEAIVRHRSPASIVSNMPTSFPATYPISLLSSHPLSTTVSGSSNGFKESGNLQVGLGEIAAVIIIMLLLGPPQVLWNFFEGALEVEGKDNFSRFLSQLMRILTSVLANGAYPSSWLNINILAHRVTLKVLDPVSTILQRDFIPNQQASYTFNTSLWRDLFALLLCLLSSDKLVIEDFGPQKRRAVWRLAGDIRGEGAQILSRMWESIGWPEQRTGIRAGGYQVQFIPSLVEGILELCLSHHDELRTNAVNVLYSMIVSEYHLNDDFTVIENEVIDRLDKLFSQSKGDEISRAFFISQLRGLFQSSHIDDRLRTQVDTFLESVNHFLDLLLGIRSLPQGDEFQDDRVSGTLKLMSFIRGLDQQIYIRYIYRLVAHHVLAGNRTEAGLTLRLHADLYGWNSENFLDPLSDLGFEGQAEFARKEMIYHQVLEHLKAGKAWETAIELCKELKAEYERTFRYSDLAGLLQYEADLYSKVVSEVRAFGSYFRVGYYGRGFPTTVQNKQFVHKGYDHEDYAGFCERMQNKHPGAQLLKTTNIPSEEIQTDEGQYLLVTRVTPEPDRTSPIFTNIDVPLTVRNYYEHNATDTFSFRRDVVKAEESVARSQFEFASTWIEKTVLICADNFPTVLRRSEIVDVQVIEISPIENAIDIVTSKTSELDNLERRYRKLGKSTGDPRKLNTNPLSQALNSAVDAPSQGGIPMFKKGKSIVRDSALRDSDHGPLPAFLGTDYMASHPGQADFVQRLRQAIDQQVLSIHGCLRLHGDLCPPEMRTFHSTLCRFFDRNFSEEIGRLAVALPDEIELLSKTQPGTNGRGAEGGINGSETTARSRAGSDASTFRPGWQDSRISQSRESVISGGADGSVQRAFSVSSARKGSLRWKK